MVEAEIIDAFAHYIEIAYGVIIIAVGMIIKGVSERYENEKHPSRKWVLKFDKDKHFPFNIRLPIVLISLFIGAGIYIFGNEMKAWDLFVTFCIANVSYEYLGKYIKKKIV
jgi:hypothetical protein